MPTPERRAELRAAVTEDPSPMGSRCWPISSPSILALLDAADERDELRAAVDTLGRIAVEFGAEIHRCREALGIDEDTDPSHAAKAVVGALARVMALAEQWRYKGEFGWGAWQEGHGPDETGWALDHAAGQIRNAIEADDDHSAAIGEHESNREPDLPNGADDE